LPNDIRLLLRRLEMQVLYDDKSDLLYIRFDDRKQEVINKRVSEDVILDLGDGDRIIEIEITDASKRIPLDRLLPVEYQLSNGVFHKSDFFNSHLLNRVPANHRGPGNGAESTDSDLILGPEIERNPEGWCLPRRSAEGAFQQALLYVRGPG